MNRDQFVARMFKAAAIAKQKHAVINTPAAVAQAALESGWGNSLLAAKYCNLFGMKKGGWKGEVVKLWTYEWSMERGYYRVLAPWRVYPSWNECLVDYSQFIQNVRSKSGVYYYRDALPHADPPDGDGDVFKWVYHLVDRDVPGEAAWATGPNYTAKVMAQAEQIASILKRLHA